MAKKKEPTPLVLEHELQYNMYDFFDKDALQEVPYKLYRIDVQNKRFYYEYVQDENGNPDVELYMGLTGMITAGLPKAQQLVDWVVDMNMKHMSPREYMKQRATYGTVMHILFTELLINEKLDMSRVEQELEVQALKDGWNPIEFKKDNSNEMRKDVLAFAQFCCDYNVKPLFIELMLRHEEGGFASAVDLGCYIDIEVLGDFGVKYKASNSAKGIKAGDVRLTKGKKTIKALIDFKSGKKGFFEAHAIQLEGCRKLVEANFEGWEGVRVFNFAPKDWKKAPTYSFKEQTDNPKMWKFEGIRSMAAIEYEEKDKSFVQMGGEVKLGEQPAENFKLVDLKDFLLTDVELDIKNKK